MSLASLFSSEQIIPEMQATERWPAMVELIDLLVSQDRIAPASRDGILAALKQREETMSTGIGFGIAIPHASSEDVSELWRHSVAHAGDPFDALTMRRQTVVLFIVPKISSKLTCAHWLRSPSSERSFWRESRPPPRRERFWRFSGSAHRNGRPPYFVIPIRRSAEGTLCNVCFLKISSSDSDASPLAAPDRDDRHSSLPNFRPSPCKHFSRF
jgi:mannitol/fructose-specific phosphotransferase system IIA component (Ntr-type)